jgi:cation-transporting P-type ATPase J
VIVVQESSRPTPASAGSPPGRLWAVREARWAIVALMLFALGGVAQLADAPAPLWWALYLACYVTGGWEPALAGVRALRDRSLDVDLLMIIAAIAAAGIGQVFDGALLIVIFSTSGALESFVGQRTADSVRALLELAPERATRLLPDGREEVVDTSLLDVGDIVVVRPGERIGADGEVVAGWSDVDQSSITGESLPVVRRPGDAVFAGTHNGTGALRVRVTRPAAESAVARIVTLVEKASATKARTQLFIEKVEQRYSVAVVVATLALVAVPLVAGASFESTLLRAMTFMIVASPCAVVLATMPPLLAAIANVGRNGVLVKSAVVMETFHHIDVVAFDKTGTLTEGTPRIGDVDLVRSADLTDDAVLTWAAAAEQSSEHPIGRAVVAAARERGITIPAATTFSATPGRGVTATVEGRRISVGSPALLGATTDSTTRACTEALIDKVEEAGRTAVVVMAEDQPVAVLTVSDRLRPDARRAVAALRSLTGRSPVLLTGDNARAAAQLAAEVGISDVRAGLLPEHKVDAVAALQAAGHRVLLVGDGVNDAPALATADIGVAMGRHGSDLALETADAVIVRDELSTLPAMVALSRRANRVVRANLAFATVVIVSLVTWDLLGTLPLPLGVAGHEGSTVIVGLNGLRLLRKTVWKHATRTAAPPTQP